MRGEERLPGAVTDAALGSGSSGSGCGTDHQHTDHPQVDVVVREALGDDLDAVQSVGREAFPSTYAGIIEPELIQLLMAKWWTKDALIPLIRSRRAYLAEVDGRPVGMCSFGKHEGAEVVWKLYVVPRYHGAGIGGALLDVVRRRVREEGSGLPLRLSFMDGNAWAREFCLRHGFEEVAREEQVGMPELVWMEDRT